MSFLDPVLSPILNLPPLAAILIMSFLITLVITIVYKYMTDQTLMKDLKERQKTLQKKAKEAREKKDMDKMMKIQKELMDANMKYMTQSFKPTLITFIPIIIIFAWMSANLAYDPLMPGQEFMLAAHFNEGFSGPVSINTPEGLTVVGPKETEISNGTAQFTLKGTEGDYLAVLNYNNKSYDKEISITTKQRYAPVIKTFKKQPIKDITLSNEKLIAINLLGKDEGGFFSGRVGWLGTYIIASLLLSFGLRKLMKIY